MANSHKIFQRYNSTIKLTEDTRTVLLSNRNSLRDRIKKKYSLLDVQDKEGLEINFQSQGSFIMDTIIRPVNDDFDLDDGIYFKGQLKGSQLPAPAIFHSWIIDAIDVQSEYENVSDKPACVRVKYKQGFHIDLPMYYVENQETPRLAHKNEGWIISSPVEFIAWFEEKAESGFQKAFLYEYKQYKDDYHKWLNDIRKEDSQLRRLVRYTKAWADLKRSEMPCGIIMTILVGNTFVLDERDDVAFYKTLCNINEYLENNGFKCPRPTSPAGEDLFASTDEKQKEYFIKALEQLIQSAKKAISSETEEEACKEWQKHLGGRFKMDTTMYGTGIKPVINEPRQLEPLKQSTNGNRPWFPKN